MRRPSAARGRRLGCRTCSTGAEPCPSEECRSMLWNKGGVHGRRREARIKAGVAASRGQMRTYAVAVDAPSRACLTGAREMRATPMAMNTADPISSLRAMKLRYACTAMTLACAKLDHVVKAIRLRCAEGLREASSK